MNINVILGIAGGMAVLLASILISLGSIGPFIDMPSILIVVGGSACALFICFPFRNLKSALGMTVKCVTNGGKRDYGALVTQIIEMAQARRKGESAFDAAMKNTKHEFLRDAASILFWTDAEVSAEEFRDLLETKARTYITEAKESQKVYKTLAKFPPAFGMMGTVLGLIALLQSLGSADAKSQIGPAMAIALITTLYGIAINNVFVMPVGEGLAKESAKDLKDYELVIEGIMLIQQKKPTKYIEEKLNAFLLPDQRAPASKSGTSTIQSAA